MKYLGRLMGCACEICEQVGVARYVDERTLAIVSLVSGRGSGVFRRFVRLDLEVQR